VEAPRQPLFREQALSARRSPSYGSILLIRPLSFAVLTWIAAAFALATCLFLAFGSYTKRTTVAGQLVSDAGLARIYPVQTGFVLERHVVEGQEVKAGDVLFVVSSDRSSLSQGATQAAISTSVRQREASLETEIDATRTLQRRERQDLELKIGSLQAELGKVAAQIADQAERVRMAQESATHYQELKDQDLVSGDQLQQKRSDLLDQRARLQGLWRDQLVLGRELAADQSEAATKNLRQRNQLSQLDRSRVSASQELVESEAKRRFVISAPEAGTATAVLANVGQSVDPARSMVSIVPAGAHLHAELYAPSRAVGFVRPGEKVLIRYEAFPYEKFGHQDGVVESVARTALPGSELTTIDAVTDNGRTEPLYRITVRLVSQTVPAYGQHQPLQSGMLLEADVLQERRRLYEWVLEPLYSLSGKL